MLIHTVFFWLKRDLTDDQLKTFESWLQKLSKISSVEKAWYGTPSDTQRPVVDRTYDYALTVVLKGMEGHNAYQVDSAHKQFIETCNQMWLRVQIYDFDATE